jgi:hypothetical protein
MLALNLRRANPLPQAKGDCGLISKRTFELSGRCPGGYLRLD